MATQHAKGEVVSGATISDLDSAPRAMGSDEDEEIDGAVAAILVVEALEPSGCGRDRLARFRRDLSRQLRARVARERVVCCLPGRDSLMVLVREKLMHQSAEAKDLRHASHQGSL